MAGDETPSKSETKSETKSDTNSGDSASASDAPGSYSRGENQKPVSRTYKNNWNAIFAKKKPKR